MDGESIVNKQITVDAILELTDYLKEIKDKYIQLRDEEKERDIERKNRIYDMFIEPTLNYDITFTDNREVKQSDYNWFVENLKSPSKIKHIHFHLSISYTDYSIDKDNGTYKNITVNMFIWNNKVDFNIYGKEMENETNEIYSHIRNIFDSCEDKYDKTIKGKFLRVQSVCFAIGFILSYIVYIVLLINKVKLPEMLAGMMANKFILVFGQWVVASVLGNIFGRLFIVPLYANILPERKYSHYNSSTQKTVYVDDIEGYKKDCEVHIDKLANSKQNRAKIEKLYKVTNKIVLAQLLISIVLFLILK